MKVVHKAPEEKRESVGNLVASTWWPVELDRDGKIIGDAVDLLPIMKDPATEGQLNGSKQLVSGAQELFANGVIEKVMPQLQSV